MRRGLMRRGLGLDGTGLAPNVLLLRQARYRAVIVAGVLSGLLLRWSCGVGGNDK